MKVQWRGQPVEEATWETEREMWSRYPHLFETPSMILDPFEDELYLRGGECNGLASHFMYCSSVPLIIALHAYLWLCDLPGWLVWFWGGFGVNWNT